MKFRSPLLFSLSLLAASGVAASERRTLVTVGPEVAIGLGDACISNEDTTACGPAQATSGFRGAATTKVNPELSFGMSGSFDRSSSGNFDIWKATVMGLWSPIGRVESGRWMSAEAGMASTTAIIQLGGGTKTFHAPHLGFNWGYSWNPGGGAVLGVALQGAVSFFSIGERSLDHFETVLWLGAATSVGYSF
jgi:hypothetical protein